MAKHTIVLMNGESIELETTLSIATMKRLREKGQMPKSILQNMTATGKEVNTEEMIDDSAEAVYIAYINATEEPMEKDRLFELLPYDLITNMSIYGEVIGGPQLGKSFAESFSRYTKKDTKAKK